MSTITQRSFSGGEIAPALYARVDISKYQTGLRKCKNFFVMRHGGVANRTGSKFVAEVGDSSSEIRLIPFVFNTSQTYCLEFGDGYMRVHQNGEQLTEAAKTITGITQANPAVVTSAAHGYSNGDEVYLSGIVGMTELNGRSLLVANKTANTFELQYTWGSNVDSSAFAAYTSGGSSYKVYEIVSPYAAADLDTIRYVQSADVIIMTHPSYGPRTLSRVGHTSWSFAAITFGPTISYPTSVAAAQQGTTGSTTYQYRVTAVQELTFEESPPGYTASSSITNGNAVLDSTNYVNVTWTASSGAIQYNVYKSSNGVYGFIGVSGGTSFKDIGYVPDTTDTPAYDSADLTTADYRPSCVTFFQQRLMFANQNADPEIVYGSKTGLFYNFSVSSPVQNDDSISFSLAGRQVNSVKHMLDLGKLVLLTESGEWVCHGDQDGSLTPGVINPKQQSYNGANDLPPLIIGSTALYVQARGSIIRDLAFDFQSDGYRGNDLTIFAAHLFDGYTISDWTYQQIPHSILWCARSDGTMLGFTYVKDQQILAWHQHEFSGGLVENVCSIPEGSEDTLYVVVQRTIDGHSVKYIEKLTSRQVTDTDDYKFVDSHLSYDGRNTNTAHTMTLSGSGWTYEDTLTLTSSTAYFASTDVGNQIHLTGSDGTFIRCSITEYTSTTVVSVTPNKTVPAAMQAAAISDWSKAVDQINGLYHLEGESVSVYADSFVVANPNNSSYEEITVADGSITLDKPYSVIHVGLPITADIQSLDIDNPNGESILDRAKLTEHVSLHVHDTRGLWAGADEPVSTATDGLTEYKIRNEEGYDDSVALKTGVIEVNIKPEWNSNGRVFVRQIDPLPASILAIAAGGRYPMGGG